MCEKRLFKIFIDLYIYILEIYRFLLLRRRAWRARVPCGQNLSIIFLHQLIFVHKCSFKNLLIDRETEDR